MVTNAAAAHLEGLGSIDGVADAKAELYAGLPAGGVAVVNADDARMLGRARASGRRLLTFAVGRQRRGDVAVLEVLSQDADGMRFLLGVGNRELQVKLPLVGAHNAPTPPPRPAPPSRSAAATGRSSAAWPASGRWGGGCGWSGCPAACCCSTTATTPTRSPWWRRSAPWPSWPAPRGAAPLAVLGDMLELGPGEAELHRERRGRGGPPAGGAALRLRAALAGDAGPGRWRPGSPPDRTFHTEDVAALAAAVRVRRRRPATSCSSRAAGA